MSVDIFKDSLLYVMFPNLDTPAGEALLASVAEYVMSCMGGEEIQEKCPKLFECFVVHSIAYIIASWGFSVEDGSFTVPPVKNEAKLFLKSKTVAQEKCEWAEISKCRDCSKDVLEQFKAKFMQAKETCDLATGGGVIIAGTWENTCFPATSCGSDSWR